jgi:hypothetical protein
MTTSTTTHTVVGLYNGRGQAERAVQDLVNEGFSRDDVSVLAPGTVAASSADTPNIGPIAELGSDMTAGTGAAIGGFAGFIAGMAALAIPGIGPVLAAGPLAAGIMGAGLGAAAGGIAGALKSHGIPETHAGRYSEAVGRGGCLVMVQTSENRVDHAADVLDRNGAVSVDEPGEHVAGSEMPHRRLTPEAVEAAKLHEGEGVRDRQRAHERRVGIFPGITGSGPNLNS